MSSEKELVAKLRSGDPHVKMGEPFRNSEFHRILVFDENTQDFEQHPKVICKDCFSFMSAGYGNHLRRHALERCPKRRRDVQKENVIESEGEPSFKSRKITEFSMKRFRDGQIKKITSGLASFTVKTGLSFNRVGSEPFKDLILAISNAISSGYEEEARKQLPCRQTIQKFTEEQCRELIKDVLMKAKKYATRIHWIVDHGKIVVNYLSVFASYVDDEFKLQVVPMAFIPALDGKTGRATASLIAQRMVTFGWTEEEVYSGTICADGALSNLSSFFTAYVRCVSHSLNLVAQKIVNPLESGKKSLREELKILEGVKEAFSCATSLSSLIRSNSTLCEKLPKLPSLFLETRWMSQLRCLLDCLELLPILEQNSTLLTDKGKTILGKLTVDYSKIIKSIVTVMDELLIYNDLFQSQKTITLHLVLPVYKSLRSKWSNFKNGNLEDVDVDSVDEATLRALATTGILAIDHYMEEFNDIHLGAVFLSPRTKRMTSFTDAERGRARRYVMTQLPKEPTPPQEEKQESKTKLGRLVELMMDKYICEPVQSSESLEDYWRRKKEELPNLYAAAVNTFSVVPSESVCESTFSTASFLLDKRRTRLQYTNAELVVLGSQLASKYPDLVL